MLMTITNTTRPATDLGYLLHKNPARAHAFELSFGDAHVFYTEATDERCSACLRLDIDPVGLVRGRAGQRSLDEAYVNDRPYVASSAKRSLALREYALGIEDLERFVRREPLRKVHECAFGVLALESEPVDIRL